MKKKLVALLLTTCMVMGLFSGCAEKEKTAKDVVETTDDGASFNNEYAESMVTMSGTEISVSDENVNIYKTSGFGYVTPDSWADIVNQDGLDLYSYDPEAFFFYYIPQANIDEINALAEGDDEDAYTQAWYAAYDAEIAVFALWRVNPNEEDTVADAEEIASEVDHSEEIMTIGDNTYYFGYSDLPTEGFSEQDLADIQIMLDSMEELKQGLIFFPPTNPIEDFKVDLSSFSTETLKGEAVDQSIFADYDVTMINCWTTWCQYCIEEMPALEQLYKNLPEGANLITICFDAETEHDTAVQEMDETGTTFPVLVANEELSGLISDYLSGYPTTFFVDSEGHVVGELQIGAPSTDNDEALTLYTELLNSVLESVQK